MNGPEVIKYLKLILNKWILWLFVLLDIVGVSVQFFAPKLSLPPIAYGFFAIVGFFWAGYQVHNETKKSYEDSLETYRQNIDVLSNKLNVDDIIKEQNVAIYLKEGHEYIFEFDKETLDMLIAKMGGNKENQYFLPASDLNIFLRIENIGCSIDVLVMGVRWETAYETPFYTQISRSYLTANIEAKYPISLEANNVLECNLRMAILPNSGITNAQFASRLRNLRDNNYLHKMKISLESIDGRGDSKKFSTEHEISLRPLVDLYIANWQENNQNELIRLAGGVTHKVNASTDPDTAKIIKNKKTSVKTTQKK